MENDMATPFGKSMRVSCDASVRSVTFARINFTSGHGSAPLRSMSRLLFLATAILLMLRPEVRGSVASYAAPKVYLEIDTARCGVVEKYEGGDLRAPVVVESATQPDTGLPLKHIGSSTYAPL